MKIMVVGYSGSGKSTLAREYQKNYQSEILHLDQVHHLPHWQERHLEDEKVIVKQFLDYHSSWVIDGNYFQLYFDRRLKEADMVVMLLFNRFHCLFRIIKRYRRYKGKSRPDMAEGCYEKIDREFLKWILWEGRTKEKRLIYRQIESQYPDKVVILKNQKQLDQWKKEKL